MTKEKRRLTAEKAVALWRNGPSVWADWWQRNPQAVADFSDPSFRGFSIRPGAAPNDFRRVTFRGHITSFHSAQFGEGDVNFYGAQFNDGHVNFCEARFGDGTISFFDAQFGNGDAYFDRAEFGSGHVDFRNVNFVKGKAIFIGTRFGEGAVSFDGANFGGSAIFSSLVDTASIERVSFRNARFDGPFILSGRFSRPVDLRNTKMDFHADLSELRCNLPRKHDGWFLWVFPRTVAEDAEDEARLRRLKELAEDARHHAAALRFHADEQRAKRWRERTGLSAMLDWSFDLVSDYGQSVWRPAGWWLAVWFFAGGVYAALSRLFFTTFYKTWTAQGPIDAMVFNVERLGAGLVLSGGNALALAPGARLARDEAISTLYAADPSLFVGAFGLVQGVVSVIFLFLIGLGLRNRFRL